MPMELGVGSVGRWDGGGCDTIRGVSIGVGRRTGSTASWILGTMKVKCVTQLVADLCELTIPAMTIPTAMRPTAPRGTMQPHIRTLFFAAATSGGGGRGG